MRLTLESIRQDGGTQPRALIDFAVIESYCESMQEGARFPPIDVFFDGSEYWLADGFHRVRAALGAGFSEIEATIHQGIIEDAQWFSFGANRANGLYRSNADKYRAIKAALSHSRSEGLSDNAIAKHVGVHHSSVAAWREKLSLTCGVSKMPETRTATRNGKRYEINVSNIGKEKGSTPEIANGEVWSVLSNNREIESVPRSVRPKCISPFKVGLQYLREASALYESGDFAYINMEAIEVIHEFLEAVIREASVDSTSRE